MLRQHARFRRQFRRLPLRVHSGATSVLTLTAATVAEARRQSVQRAVVIVHEFVSALTRAEYRARTGRDLDGFLEIVFGHTGSVGPGTIAGPFRIDGRGALYFGKTETVV